MKSTPLVAFAAALFVGAVSVRAGIVDLGNSTSGLTFPQSINNNGTVVGSSGDSSTMRPAMWNNGVTTQLGVLGVTTGTAYRMNSAGDVVGVASLAGPGSERAFLYHNGQMTDLGTFGGDSSYGYGVNASGHVVGFARGTHNEPLGFLYRNGTMEHVGFGLESGTAYAINDNGHITGGAAGPPTFATHAFLQDDLGIHDLGTLGDGFSVGRAINIHDQIAGYFQVSPGLVEPFLYSNGTMVSLGNLNGAPFGTAANINNNGLVVGSSGNAAFLYQNGQMTDLNSLLDPGSGWVLLAANGINDAGDVVGVGMRNGEYHGFLLTAVPEPVAAIPCALVLAGFVIFRIRRATLPA